MFPAARDIDIKEILSRCVKCGRCQAVCPVYAVSSTEDNCARGKIQLIEKIFDNESDFKDYIKRALNRCVACSACQDACKNDVNYIDLMAAGRGMMNESTGEPLIKKMILSRFAERSEAEEISHYGSIISKLFQSRDGKGSGITLKFPIPGLGDGMYIPPLAEESFVIKHGGLHRAKKEWTRLAFFVGCSSSFILPEIAESILKFLVSNGVTVVVPPDQVCCGTPHYLSGEPDMANELLGKNRNAFAAYNVDAVITGCPTCGG
jgi:glycolate oxidase iron-sulfur subunit